MRGALWGVLLYLAGVGAAFALVIPFSAGQSPQPIETSFASASSSLPIVIVSAVVNEAYEEIFLQRGLRIYGAEIAVGASLLVRVSITCIRVRSVRFGY